jgi:hypothetical protein
MAEKQNIHPLICDFIASKDDEDGSQYLYPKGDGENPSSNPRKWEIASDFLYAGASLEMREPLLGEDIVRDFSTFCKDEHKAKKTRIEKMNPDNMPCSSKRRKSFAEIYNMQIQKLTVKEHVQNSIDIKICPTIIRCHSGQDWQTLFDKPPVVMDATKMTFAELSGTDYQKRTYFEPAWFQKLLSKKVLVIENLDMLTPKDEELTDDLEYSEYGEAHPGQISFLFLCRCNNETEDYRALNSGSPCIIPTDVSVFIIQRDNPKHQIIQPIFSRCGVIDMAWDNE